MTKKEQAILAVNSSQLFSAEMKADLIRQLDEASDEQLDGVIQIFANEKASLEEIDRQAAMQQILFFRDFQKDLTKK